MRQLVTLDTGDRIGVWYTPEHLLPQVGDDIVLAQGEASVPGEPGAIPAGTYTVVGRRFMQRDDSWAGQPPTWSIDMMIRPSPAQWRNRG